MDNNISEIHDKRFFFAKDGYKNPKSELDATIDAFFSNEKKDDNSSICRFPARYYWLKKQLNGYDFPHATCREYDKVLEAMDPQSATLVFASAHINSPASMFGHTFLRINSSYHSKLLSYAISYAADSNPDTTNAIVFAIKGIFGGYLGKYSLLPYYDKLKEYRDMEQRDIWEYDLNFTKAETLRMFRHIWELQSTRSYYYFFTQNCAYNLLWLLESGRPSLHLRKHFLYQVIPLETLHVAKKEKIIKSYHYRASKRTKLLRYEKLIEKKYMHYPIELVNSKIRAKDIAGNKSIELNQKRYILESAIEYLEYQFSKGKIKKEKYLTLFHAFTMQRAKLGITKPLQIKTPANPIYSHRAIRTELGFGEKENDVTTYLGIRPAYHDLGDSDYGFLRGTQIEFLNLLISSSKKETKVEKATIVSIASLAQRSEFIKSFSWRGKIGWDNDYLTQNPTFHLDIGAGVSWGNRDAFVYFLVDPTLYLNSNVRTGIGGSAGINIDRFKNFNTSVEVTQRVYDNGINQLLIEANQGMRTSQNTQILLKYNYKDKLMAQQKEKEETYMMLFKYYF